MSKRQDTNTREDQPGNASSEALARMDELVKRRDEINERISGIQSEKSRVFSIRQNLQKSIFDLQDRLRGMPENDQRYTTARKELTDSLIQARADYAENEDYQKQLDEEAEQLKNIELPACVVAVCGEDVKEHQQRVCQATVAVNNIQAVIDSQNQSIAEARAAIPQRTNRQQERHNLLADIAMGSATDSDLKKLDAAIEKEQKTVAAAEKNAAPLIEQAQATVSGLMRKLESAKAELQDISSKSAEVAYRYFMGEAEKVAVQYVNHAMRLKELHIRLTGLDVFIQKHDLHGIVRREAKQIHIPMFRLPQFDGLNQDGGSSLLDGFKMMSANPVDQAAEIEQLRYDAIRSGHLYQ